MIFIFSLFLGILSIINKILLFLEKKTGWISGIAIGLTSGFYFWIVGLKILAVSEFGFFLVMLYGYIRNTKPSIRVTFLINLVISIISIFLCYLLFTGSLTFIETISSLSFIWGGYELAVSKKLFGWSLLLLAHITTAVASFYVAQIVFAWLQLISGLVCVYALVSIVKDMLVIKKNFKVEVWDSSKEGQSWEDVKERIMLLENEEYQEKSFPIEQFEYDFKRPETIAVLLKDYDSNIIGYTYSQPIGFAFPDRVSENKDTALIWNTIIEKKWRGKHLVGLMMSCIEDELRKKGYKFIEREARVENNYASNVAKHYAGRIIKQSEPHDSPWGTQVFFRITL